MEHKERVLNRSSVWRKIDGDRQRETERDGKRITFYVLGRRVTFLCHACVLIGKQRLWVSDPYSFLDTDVESTTFK